MDLLAAYAQKIRIAAAATPMIVSVRPGVRSENAVSKKESIIVLNVEKQNNVKRGSFQS